MRVLHITQLPEQVVELIGKPEPLFLPYMPGRFYAPAGSYYSNGEEATTNMITFMPFFIREDVQISEIHWKVYNVTGPGNAVIGIYSHNLPVSPTPTGTPVWQHAYNAGGAQDKVVAGVGIALYRGLYWLAATASSPITYHSVDQYADLVNEWYMTFGSDTAQGPATYAGLGFRKAYTFDGTLPYLEGEASTDGLLTDSTMEKGPGFCFKVALAIS
jgi:hypothetical protein